MCVCVCESHPSAAIDGERQMRHRRIQHGHVALQHPLDALAQQLGVIRPVGHVVPEQRLAVVQVAEPVHDERLQARRGERMLVGRMQCHVLEVDAAIVAEAALEGGQRPLQVRLGVRRRGGGVQMLQQLDGAVAAGEGVGAARDAAGGEE